MTIHECVIQCYTVLGGKMKYVLLIFLSIISAYHVLAKGASDENSRESALVIMSYDSFVSEWGLGTQIKNAFTEQYGYDIEFVTYGDAIQTFNTLRHWDTTSSDYPDMMIGIDNNMAYTVLSSNIFKPNDLPNDLSEEALESIPRNLFLDDKNTLVPFDYGYISIVYNSNTIQNPPTSLEDLTDSRFKDSLILIDPRSSSPGLAFFLWTVDAYGDRFLEYWERLKPSILSIPNDWTVAYGIFTTGEAPLVLSYTTSPAYHIEYEGKTNIQSTVFDEGNYLQIEYAGITKAAPNPQAARAFLAFMLSEKFQNNIALTNIMYPAKKDTPLPQSFATIATPKKSLVISPNEIPNDAWLSSKIAQWEEVMATK